MTCYEAPHFHSERCYQAGLRDGQRAAQAAVDEGADVSDGEGEGE